MFPLALASVAGLAPRTASADHTVWIDFETLDFSLENFLLDEDDLDEVKAQIVAGIQRNFSHYSILIQTHKPGRGRYSRVLIGGMHEIIGHTGEHICAENGLCGTGINSWTEGESRALVFTERMALRDAWAWWQDNLEQRIITGVSNIASHELGHLLGLQHEDAQDPVLGTVERHMMIQSSNEVAATLDKYFGFFVSNNYLIETLGTRNFHTPMGNISGDSSGRDDMVYGKIESDGEAWRWYGRESDGSSLGSASTWRSNAGKVTSHFLVGDVDGDGDADLVEGRPESGTTVRWLVRESLAKQGEKRFDSPVQWRGDAGSVGDVYRLGDVDCDGRDDLVYGRPLDATTMRWDVRESNGSGFGSAETWKSDAGQQGYIYFVTDVDDEGDGGCADLVYGRELSNGKMRWYVRRSLGHKFDIAEIWYDELGHAGNRFMMGDLDGDGMSDLLYGDWATYYQIHWSAALSNGDGFDAPTVWREDVGNSGSLFRLADIDGDGMYDIVYGEKISPTHLRWHARYSTGSGFGAYTRLRDDSGGEGYSYP